MLYSAVRAAALLATLLLAEPTSAFGIATNAAHPLASGAARRLPVPLLSAQQQQQAVTDCGCEGGDVEGVVTPTTGLLEVRGSTLRELELADTTGARVPMSSLIGEEGKAVVVFLRHLG